MKNLLKYLRKVIPHNSPIRLWYTRVQQIGAYLFMPINLKDIKLIGVTGTDGKTTTVEMLSHILNTLNIPYLSTSSLDIKLSGKVLNSSKRTTPSLWQLHQIIKKAMDKGVKVIVIEASSHSLVQWRMLGLKFDATILTNITHEHLDFHKTKERYANAKKLLFTRHLKEGGVAILPTNDEHGIAWTRELHNNSITYTPPDSTTDKSSISFRFDNKKYSIPMLGSYNAGNAISAALAVSRVIDTVSTDSALLALDNFGGIPGRMQVIRKGEITVIVDFALTRKAMQSALCTARELAGENKVFVVFGATGGQHDTSVRPGLAEAASAGADMIIITDDEPYDSNPEEIRNDLIKYIKEEQLGGRTTKFENIANRREAIREALSQATNGDVVIVTGMGHYTSRTVNGEEEPWNDVEVIKEELLKMGY